MDDEDNDYELERQKTIAENRLLLDSLGLDPSGASKLPKSNSNKPSSNSTNTNTKSKSRPTKRKIATIVNNDDGPRRRSGRLLGLEAEGEELKVRLEEEEKEREVLRVVSRKERDKVMSVGNMVEDPIEGEIDQLNTYLKSISTLSNPRSFPTSSTSAKEAYADLDPTITSAEVGRLRDAFKDMSLKANAKVTTERVYTMIVHPEPTKTLVLVGDKYGQLGIWDALGPAAEKVKSEDDTSGVKLLDDEKEDDEGRIWRVQAHAKNSITCMKVDPVNGSGLFSTSYDCSLRHLSFSTLQSTELFAFADEDMLVTHFDILPSGQEAWLTDKNGGLTHVDLREDNGRTRKGKERRRWVVQDDGRGAKMGGISVNPLMPHLLVTAGNDQHLRIWDTRHLFSIPTTPIELPPLTPSKSKLELEEASGYLNLDTRLTSQASYENVESHLNAASGKGKGLLRASFKHGKSSSAAYWDPWGRRILTTSYDDKLRIWSLNPQSLLLDQPLPPSQFQPTKILPHNCQTGRWLTILRAQWSQNTQYIPHFTIGNMKRTLDVVACTGEKIVSLWTDDVTAVPAVTASHPSWVDKVVGGNTSGRIQLWSSGY